MASDELRYFAYVRFVEKTKLKDETFIVDQSQIVQKFNSDLQFKRAGKYHIRHTDGEVYKAQIIFLESTRAALEAKIARKRASMIPDDQLHTECENDDNKIIRSKSSISSDAEKEKKLQKYMSLIVTKVEKNNTSRAKTSNAEEQTMKSNFDMEIPTSEDVSKSEENQILKEVTLIHNNSQIDFTEDVKNKNPNEKKDEVLNTVMDNEEVTENDKLNTKVDKVSDNVNKKALERNKENVKQVKNKPKIISNVKIPSKKELETNSKVLDKKCKKIIELEDKLKLLQAENKQLLKSNTSLQEKVKNLKKEVTKYVNLNTDLQKEVIEKIKEHGVIQSQVGSQTSSTGIDPKKNFVPIGQYRTSDKTYHVGRNLWIMESIYDEIMSPHNTPGKCVSLILKALIGSKTLSKCTRTGRVSNRTLGNNKKLNDSDAEIESDEKSEDKPEKVDETKLAMCFDLYVHWLSNHYSTVKTDINLFEEMADFNSHVSKVISYLKRPPPKKKIQKKDESSSDEEVQAPKK